MKKTLTIVALVALLLVMVVVLAGCGSKDPIKGKWSGKNDDGTQTDWEFKGNGNCTMKNEFGFEGKGTYKVEDSKVTIKLEDWDEEKVYEFKVDGNKLSLTPTDPLSPTYAELVKQ